MIPTAAAVKKAKYKARIMFGKPKNKPKTKANLISPPPIPSLPRMNLNPNAISRKKRKAETPQARLMTNDWGLMINKYVMMIIASGKRILLRIIPYFKSIKNITMNPETISRL
jgi:hypothetical protein